jgi:hypothetical protein
MMHCVFCFPFMTNDPYEAGNIGSPVTIGETPRLRSKSPLRSRPSQVETIEKVKAAVVQGLLAQAIRRDGS